MVEKPNIYRKKIFSSFFEINVGVGQGFALSLILSALYFSPLFHIFKEHVKNLKIPVSFLSFVNDSLLVFQEKSFEKTNLLLFCSYNIISSLLNQFSLAIEYGKTEVFHFSRTYGLFNLLQLNLSQVRGSILSPKKTWYYLSFIFNRKFSFHQHINFYTNKALSMVKSMKMLGNSTQGLLPYQKHLLYRTCVLYITLYNFPLWHYNNVPLSYPLNKLNKIQ